MNTGRSHTVRAVFVLTMFLALKNISFGQGRVVVNEFMSWSGCNTTSEFIELLNFGPGPMNIGCYVVTNGQYSVTIPTNTILQPGEYYVLAGQNVLAQDCGNTDSAVTVDLNWTTCNCTNVSIPTTGDGFLKNGGGANEKVVLLSPSGTVMDAVSRSTPSASATITTSSVGGTCTSSTFDLDLMAISYEVIGIATGIDNSYSRRVDGDCGWVKTTDISAGAPNKTGSTASATYSFTTLNASQCSGTTGTISIGVSADNLSSLFPMTYVLAYDLNDNNIFESTDIYTSGSDNSSPSIDINNLPYGRYRITVGSSLGCNLQSFDFFIFNCYGIILPNRVITFKQEATRDNKRWFNASIAGLDSLKLVILEAKSGGEFKAVNSFLPNTFRDGVPTSISAPITDALQYRLRLISRSNADYYSAVLQVNDEMIKDVRLLPNPVGASTSLSVTSPAGGRSALRVTNTLGQTMLSESIMLKPGKNLLPIRTGNLPVGLYQLTVDGSSLKDRVTILFRKD
ncbi:lamin tail domain-containing protein [Flavitalea antarctica]